MSKFKVGTKLRYKGLNKDSNFFTAGKVYEVGYASGSGCYRITDNDKRQPAEAKHSASEDWLEEAFDVVPTYKVGDKVRVVTVRPHHIDITAGKTYSVARVFADGDIHIFDDVGDKNYIDSRDVEHVYSSNPAAQVDNIAAEYGVPKSTSKGGFKVGDRVTKASGGWREEGYEIKTIESDFLHLDDTNGGTVSYKDDGSFVAVAPPTATALRIEAGRYYKTRDGRKVGPMREWCDGIEHPWEDPEESNIWRNDGTSRWGDDLIAEWTEDPVAAAPKFKVGDLVRVVRHCNWRGDYIKMITPIGAVRKIVKRTDQLVLSGVDTFILDGDNTYIYTPINLELVTTPTTVADIVAKHSGKAIVALIEYGQPKPSSRPHVHANVDLATKEAERLADKHRGQEFGVYELVTTRKEAQIVYPFAWQNKAVQGQLISAIKQLRADTGLGLKTAKDAVEAWLAAVAA
ncbi:hypothetical protein [Mesorhizobium sp. M00.F.Ca.ET.217.01.1.1]|uniref:hypothetical protein n=1 Tax=Mesorhizobium sp. M00.F.Ca.ET.217.01.1.1 TaxID=2500529 RepID=UPI000FD9D638|nr:hypothetical protein [Mesorhizobium sp. M00.F.Ca.ET.217.01.1.1]TGQ19288.1 hypothetical protein EN860_019340 [Mesorhizobium sp. M00.F.Ca.ET.217.01.1.1]